MLLVQVGYLQVPTAVTCALARAHVRFTPNSKVEVKTAEQRFEHCTNINDVTQQFVADYRAEGIHLDEKDIEDLGRVMSAWWEGLHTVLACAKAKPVQSRMPDLERERHERRRAWLASASSHQW